MQKKTALDYAFKYNDINILRLFLDALYETKENGEREHNKLKLKYQKKSKKFLNCANISVSISSVIVSVCIVSDQSKSKTEETFNWISIGCSVISLISFLCNLAIDRQKALVKRKIENYTEKINKIEKATGKLAKTKVGSHDLEEYNSILELLTKNEENLSRLENELYKFTHETSLESKNKLNISPQKMSRRSSTELAERRSSSFLGNLGEKLGQYARRTSRVQDIMDSELSSIIIDKHSEKASQSKLNSTVNSLVLAKKAVGFFKKKKNPVDASSLSEGANQENITKMNEENCGLIKRFGDTNGYSKFSTPFNPSGSTSREECGNNHSAARHVSYGSANNSVSDKEVSKSPSLILSNFEEGITVDCFKFERYRPRVYSSPSCVRKRAITARSLEYVILPDHIERGK